ncbi:MAG: PQQ-dependent sugar dehydrogenase [Planctomycetota bacterium]
MRNGLMCAAALAAGCIAGAAGAQTTLERVANGIDRPVFITSAPGEPNKLFVIEQEGAIRIIEDGVLRSAPFLDIDSRVTGGTSGQDERGLLGLAFSPDYETSGRFFVYYTGSDPQLGLATIVAEYSRQDIDPSGNTAETIETRLLAFDQPFSNHNGGWMGFGPDGYLYVATGDGGAGNDPGDRASNLGVLQGKMLRLDVSVEGVASVPASNPFVGQAGAAPEIWAYGLRNPWRSSFDRETGDLWMADVGQSAREEINFQPADSLGGEHYGWRCREGTIATPGIGGCPSDLSIYTEPILDYTRINGRCSVTGGYVYRGCENPELFGKYIFGDYCSGEILAYDPMTDQLELVDNFGFGLSTFGEGPDGELYVADVLAGFIDKIVPANPVDSDGDGVLDSCETAEPCVADVNMDTVLDGGDFFAWVNAFSNNGPGCDQNADDICDQGDFFAWVANFGAGCP